MKEGKKEGHFICRRKILFHVVPPHRSRQKCFSPAILPTGPKIPCCVRVSTAVKEPNQISPTPLPKRNKSLLCNAVQGLSTSLCTANYVLATLTATPTSLANTLRAPDSPPTLTAQRLPLSVRTSLSLVPPSCVPETLWQNLCRYFSPNGRQFSQRTKQYCV